MHTPFLWLPANSPAMLTSGGLSRSRIRICPPVRQPLSLGQSYRASRIVTPSLLLDCQCRVFNEVTGSISTHYGTLIEFRRALQVDDLLATADFASPGYTHVPIERDAQRSFGAEWQGRPCVFAPFRLGGAPAAPSSRFSLARWQPAPGGSPAAYLPLPASSRRLLATPFPGGVLGTTTAPHPCPSFFLHREGTDVPRWLSHSSVEMPLRPVP